MVTIKIINHIQTNINHEDGSRVYHVIRNALQKRESVVLDFSEVDVLTSSFLNNSFRLLATDYEYDFLKSHLVINNSTRLINQMIRECVISTYKNDPTHSEALK